MPRARAAWVVALLALLAPPAAGAPLDSRRAGRALTLAFEAELAGDAEGARSALEALLEASSSSREAAGRGLLEAWLDALPERVPAWREDAGAKEVLRAWTSLEPFGAALTERAWLYLTERRPALKRRLPAVRLRLDRAAGVDREAARAALVDALRTRDVPVDPREGLELGVELDLGAVDRVGPRSRVKGHVDAVLAAPTEPPEPVTRVSQARTVLRIDLDRARTFALRRLALDVAEAARWGARRVALARAHGVSDF